MKTLIWLITFYTRNRLILLSEWEIDSSSYPVIPRYPQYLDQRTNVELGSERLGQTSRMHSGVPGKEGRAQQPNGATAWSWESLESLCKLRCFISSARKHSSFSSSSSSHSYNSTSPSLEIPGQERVSINGLAVVSCPLSESGSQFSQNWLGSWEYLYIIMSFRSKIH